MQRQKHGGDIYSREIQADFSVNISPLGVPKGVEEALSKSIRELVHYPDVECRKLRGKLGEKEKVDQESLILGNGAAELIYALVQGLKPGKVLLTAPGFAEYEAAVESTGGQLDFYELKEELGFQIQEDFLDRITEDTDMVFLCNPNNPTGVVTGRDFLLKAARRCQECRALLVVDECFIEFLEEPFRYTVKPYLREYPSLFLLKAFTKIYAMPGLRLGYGICEDREVLEKARAAIQPWNVSVLAQNGGLGALEETFYVEEVRSLVTEERKFLLQALRELGFSPADAGANYLFFRGPKGLYEACLNRGILIRDCSNYRGLTEGYYRVAVKKHQENELLIKVLKECL